MTNQTEQKSANDQPNQALAAKQRITLALLVVGYAGYYLCRSHFSVAKPLLLEEFKSQGLNKDVLGGIASIGTLAYAIGKLVSGTLADFFGGRRLFLAGMGGAVLFSVLFAMGGGVPIFTLAWVLNRIIQSAGWNGMAKITSRWFSYSAYGSAVGIISLSFLFGDFASRQFLGQLIEWHFGWRQVFFVAAGILFIIFLVALKWLKESPTDYGLMEPSANPDNVYGERGHEARPTSIGDVLLPLLRNPLFWLVAILSFGFTMVRETFNDWSPTYLHEAAGLAKGEAAKASSYFPLFGGISTILCGWLSDRLGRTGRAAILFVGLAMVVPALFYLAGAKFGGSHLMPVLLLGLIGFVLLGPYTFLAGGISLDFGGKRGGATAAGWIDGIGYFGGILAGKYIGGIADRGGWTAAFNTLGNVAILTCVAALIYLIAQRKAFAKQDMAASN